VDWRTDAGRCEQSRTAALLLSPPAVIAITAARYRNAHHLLRGVPMASLDPNFHEETVSIQHEHEQLMAQLDRLDAALEQIVCYSELFSDLATANQAIGSSKWIAAWLPRHYAHEETTVLQTIARMSPELASFAREMKRQHGEIRIRLETLRDHLAHLGENRDLEAAVAELKREGRDLTRLIRLHMSAEDNKFASIEN
jgi:Hemerythrin HHE cation binding domain